VQVVVDDDRVEALARERPRRRLEVEHARRHARHAGERGQRVRVAIDRDDVVPERGQEARVTTVAGLRGRARVSRER
jgi:hypothetical protein